MSQKIADFPANVMVLEGLLWKGQSDSNLRTCSRQSRQFPRAFAQLPSVNTSSSFLLQNYSFPVRKVAMSSLEFITSHSSVFLMVPLTLITLITHSWLTGFGIVVIMDKAAQTSL